MFFTEFHISPDCNSHTLCCQVLPVPFCHSDRNETHREQMINDLKAIYKNVVPYIVINFCLPFRFIFFLSVFKSLFIHLSILFFFIILSHSLSLPLKIFRSCFNFCLFLNYACLSNSLFFLLSIHRVLLFGVSLSISYLFLLFFFANLFSYVSNILYISYNLFLLIS
jgi:hypothetical protein